MHIESERKFLVIGEYTHLAYNVTTIKQGYFATEPGKTVRIRIRGEKAYLTIKGTTDSTGLSRYEFETEIPLDDAEQMLKLCKPGAVIKDRYRVKSGNHIVEVDEFHGDNEGLTIAEIELNAPDEEYETPDFLGLEVTGDPRYYSKYLLTRPYKLWKNEK